MGCGSVNTDGLPYLLDHVDRSEGEVVEGGEIIDTTVMGNLRDVDTGDLSP